MNIRELPSLQWLRPPYRKVKSAIKYIKNSTYNRISPPVMVLIYHRVTKLEMDSQLLAVSPDNFYKQLKYLKENYEILRFEDDWTQADKPSIVITFDDGYEDNYKEALPILEELQVPVTIFVTTGNLNNDEEYWWDELERLILCKPPVSKKFTLVDETFGQVWPTGTYQECKKFYEEIHPLMRDFASLTKREKWLEDIREWAGEGKKGRASHQSLNEVELQALGRNKWITLGAHTVNHPVLANLPYEDQYAEIEKSKETLERILGRAITTFSYPFGGKHQYNEETIEILKKQQIKKVASNYSGVWHSKDDVYEIPRNLIRNWDLEMFKKQLKRYWWQ